MKQVYLLFILFFCVVTTQAQTDIMSGYNGGFETGDMTYWRFFEVPNPLGSGCQIITSDVHSGTYAAKLTFVTGSVADRALDNWASFPPVQANKVYELKAWLKSDNPSGVQVKMTVGFFDSGNNYLSEQSIMRSLTTAYKEYSIQFLPPSNAASCFVAFRLLDAAQAYAAGTLYVDDVQLYQLATNNYNLLHSRNGDFELGTTENWQLVEVSSSLSTFNISSSDTHSGTYAAHVHWENNASTLDLILHQQSIPVTPGETYTFSAWAKSLSGPFILNMGSVFYDGGNNVLSDPKDGTWILSDAYTQHSFVLHAPVNAATLNIGFRAFNADGSRWPAGPVECMIDDVQLNQQIIVSTRDVLSLSEKDFYRIYPSPAREYINIQSVEKPELVTIYSINGQKLKTVNSNCDRINISDLEPGIYYVGIQITNGVELTRKLIVN
ncbi:MAG: Carbohydrate binding domain protein [Bacteroidetes bacterium ADurb.Bin174]|nr:MAG: Carbohydrate binding domain protein [Bacteroidetes bacterium ADurb.Bin174]